MSWLGRAVFLLVFVDAVGLLAASATWSRHTALPVPLRPLLLFGLSVALGVSSLAGWKVLMARRDPSDLSPPHEPAIRSFLLPGTIYALAGMSALLAAGGLLSLPVVRGAARPVAASLARGERSVTLLAVNDIYRVEGLEGGAIGGLARLRTLRSELEGNAPGRVLLLHAGDVLFPSFLSRTYEGRQMIDVMNLLDGDPTPGRLDERLFVVFGNHEFEKESCDKPSPLAKRVAESDFFWLHSNIALSPCRDGRPRLVGSNLLPARIVEAGGIRVGLFGLTIESKHPSFAFLDPLETAALMTADLRRRGAEIVIAVTHLPKEQDVRIYQALHSRGLDLVIGGHDHEHMRHPEDEPRIFKADSDAATAWVIDLVLEADGRLRVKSSLRELGRNIRPDPIVAERVATWLESHQRAFCEADSKPPGCLGDVLATAKTRLVASEEKIRNAETSVGNWVADVMLEAFAGCRADASIINAGGLRMNQDLAAGTPITRRHIEELMQYRTDLYLLELTGEQLQAVITHAISEPGAGRWLQVSGLAFVYDADTRTVVRLVVRPAAGGSPVDVSRPGQKFRVVVNKFLIEDKEEGYDVILGAAPAVQCTASAPDLKVLVYGALAAKKEIAPAIEGRICKASETTTTRCQAETWLKGGAR